MGPTSIDLTGRVHEPDFEAFRLFEGLGGLFLDVGANVGQSAVSLFRVNTSLTVLSLEPNPDLAPALDRLRRRFPGRFDFLPVAAAETSGESTLCVPQGNGIDLSVNGSLNEAEFEKAYVRNRIRAMASSTEVEGALVLARIPVRTATIDSLGVWPLIIKIDVEGFESSVLRGAEGTIRRAAPVLLVENNNTHRFGRILTDWGYAPFVFKADCGGFEPMSWAWWEWGLNSFWFPPQLPSGLTERLAPRFPTAWSFSRRAFSYGRDKGGI